MTVRYLLGCTLAALTPWQLYIVGSPLGTLSFVQLLLVPLLGALLLGAILRPGRTLLPRNTPILLLISFVALCFLSVLWSDDPTEALKTAGKLAGVVTVALALSKLPARRLTVVVTTLGVSTSLLAVMIVLFRIFPLLEVGFWLSGISELVLDPDILEPIRQGTARINSFDAGKAGGTFTNANAASLLLGITLFLVIAVRESNVLTHTIAGILALGVLATGSKAGFGMLAVTGSVWIAWQSRNQTTLLRLGMIGLAGVAGTLALWQGVIGESLLEASVTALESRFAVWSIGAPVLLDHSMLGLGFGGWERWSAEMFRFVGVSEQYPLHNLVLIAWAWTGVLGAVLIVAFLGTSVFHPLKTRWPETPWTSDTSLALSLLFTWLLGQSMFTNAALTDIRIGLPVGLALSLLLAGRCDSGHGMSEGRDNYDH